MNSYKQRSIWNVLLLVVGVLILLITVVYANYLAKQLSIREEKIEDLYNKAQAWFAENPDLEADASLPNYILSQYNLPVILVDADGNLSGNNWGEQRDTIESFLRTKVDEAINKGITPIEGRGPAKGVLIYPFKSKLSTYIQFFPVVQFLLIGFFIALGYYLFNTARKSEQNRVWAGMAKETAHQLGTPISAIIGWIENLKETESSQLKQQEVIQELQKDVDRLELIADRFSKIGSDPELEVTNIYDQLDEIETYMRRRSPRKVDFEFPESQDPIETRVNRHLFSWVLENLIRNSLDALDGQGTISALVKKENNWVSLDISDTGKGIPSSKFKEVFKPGFSTKKRGWGLGLSLAKRIIEEYHKGKIYIKSSKVNEGTTFTIQLPLA